VARIYELAGALQGPSPSDEALRLARFEAMETLCRLVAPMMPHLAEEIFALLRPDAGLVVAQPWPVADAALLVVDEVTIAVQVNGKLRGTITVAAGAGADDVLPIAKQAVAGALGDQKIVKEIFVPDRIVNFVVKP
jgi:leucyl-tRNA synthetase